MAKWPSSCAAADHWDPRTLGHGVARATPLRAALHVALHGAACVRLLHARTSTQLVSFSWKPLQLIPAAAAVASLGRADAPARNGGSGSGVPFMLNGTGGPRSRDCGPIQTRPSRAVSSKGSNGLNGTAAILLGVGGLLSAREPLCALAAPDMFGTIVPEREVLISRR